jgi:release factor glutamine methyltransferase
MKELNLMPQKPVTVNSIIQEGYTFLAEKGQPDAKRDAKLLAMHFLGYNMGELLFHWYDETDLNFRRIYFDAISQRALGIPLQHLTHEQEFMGFTFYVNENVLIPRQDTETLVETILNLAKNEPIYQAVEIGVGSGCISIACAKYLPELKITAIDISEKALEVAKKNIELHEVAKQVTLLKSDLFENYPGKLQGLDLVISNPPYISLADCDKLMTEVINYEPRCALTDEADGLTFYKKITVEAKKYLKDGGLLAYEIGCDQGKAVSKLMSCQGFTDILVIKDLAKKDRVVIGRHNIKNK